MKNINPRIAVITQAPFPIGNVSTMRIISYLKSLSSIGIFTYVLIYCPTRMAAHIHESSGCFGNIHYQYATDITWKRYNIIFKIWYTLKGLFKSIEYLNTNKISTVILYGDNLFIVNLFYWLYARIFRKRFIGDRSELPSVQTRNSKFRLTIYGLKQRMFDGMIVMTKQLVSFYSQYSTKNDFIFFLPMTVDPCRFDNLKEQNQNDPYIAVVFGTHNRDGLLESLKSFDLYCQKGGTYSLKLIGDYNNMPNKLELDQFINSSVYRSRINIIGKQSNDKVPYLLFNASILMTTPNYYVSGGFPTKLGEYMLSGVPIVATEVGELLDYVIPNKDMIICKPRDFDSISSALFCLERDHQFADELASNAKKKAKAVFCADSYVKDLAIFLNN